MKGVTDLPRSDDGEGRKLDDIHKEDDGLPIDRGWAWMILAGSFLNIILVVGYTRAVGVLFVEYLKVFEASATKTTLFMGVMPALYSISSLFSMNILLQLIGVRKLVLLGGALTSLGMLTAVFATSITYLICTHSVLIGIGHSMIHGPSLVLIGQYFNKRRGLATAMSNSGISLGICIFPPLVTFFIDEYLVRGSMLLMTGLSLHILVGGLLYRPLESFHTRNPNGKNKRDNTKTMVCLEGEEVKHVVSTSDEMTHYPLLCHDVVSERNPSNLEATANDKGRPISECNQRSESSVKPDSQLQLYRSNPELSSLLMIDIAGGNSATTNNQDKPRTICDYLKIMVTSLDFSLFKHPMFQLIVITTNFGVISSLATIYLPALADEKGIEETEASLLLTINGATDFFARLVVGYVADLKFIKVHHLIVIGMLISGTVSHFVSLYDSYALLVVYSVVTGMFGGFFICLLPVVVIDFMGQEHMAKVLGFIAVFQGLSTSVTHPILGAIRDLTGSYNICYNYIGTCNYIAVICLLCEPLSRRRAQNLKYLTD